jgi:hypothetical protein
MQLQDLTDLLLYSGHRHKDFFRSGHACRDLRLVRAPEFTDSGATDSAPTGSANR